MSEKTGNSAHNNSFNGTDTAPLSPDANASDNAQTTANKRIPATNPGTRIPAFAKRVHTAPALTAAHAASKNTQGNISFSGSPLRTIKNDNPIKRITHIRLPASTPVPTAPKSDRLPSLFLAAFAFTLFVAISSFLSHAWISFAIRICAFSKNMTFFRFFGICTKTVLYLLR